MSDKIAYQSWVESKFLPQYDNPRAKDDNIATKNEVGGWRFISDNPIIHKELNNRAGLTYHQEDGMSIGWELNYDGYLDLGFNLNAGLAEGDAEATSLDFGIKYWDADGKPVTVKAIRDIITKSGEPYVTPTGVRNIAIPKYDFVDAEIVDGVLTVAPYTNAKLVSDGTAFTVAVNEGDGKTRDCALRVECGETAPTIIWPVNFHPRTDAATDFACTAEVRNVYWITEYAPGEFAVASWQETKGGGTSGGAA